MSEQTNSGHHAATTPAASHTTHAASGAVAHSGKDWYNRWYKPLLVIPIILLIASLVYLGYFYKTHGDIMLRDTSLAGGTTVTLPGDVDQAALEEQLTRQFNEVYIRAITNIQTGEPVAVLVESASPPAELKTAIEAALGYELTPEKATIEFTGPTLSQNFYKQLIIALIFSFILICVVIFILFRTLIPSLAVIFAIFANIVMPLALIDALGIRISAAGIAAFLMLIGYSVDTDILLTSRVLRKREGTVNQRIFGAFKTGIFMNITALLAILPAFFIVTGIPDSFRQIFFILALGLGTDILNTWLTNASLIKWYTEVKKIT